VTVHDLADRVGADGALVHLRALQSIADENGGTRVTLSPGYRAGVEYVARVLGEAGFEVDTPTYPASGKPYGVPGTVTLRNVIGQTRTGDPHRVVLAGAHLDSVAAGPGINDNGSGVAALLEVATALGGSPEVRNRVPRGTDLKGSTGYVDSLTPARRRDILLYLNVDMVASSNGGYFVQGGRGKKVSRSGPAGSGLVARVVLDQLAATGVTGVNLKFDDAESDYGPFIDAGVPTAGVLDADNDVKTAEQARAWGGRAGEPVNPHYHRKGDTLAHIQRSGGIGLTLLDHWVRALAGSVAQFARFEGPLG
jgi:aminopeptidase S